MPHRHTSRLSSKAKRQSENRCRPDHPAIPERFKGTHLLPESVHRVSVVSALGYFDRPISYALDPSHTQMTLFRAEGRPPEHHRGYDIGPVEAVQAPTVATPS